MNEMGFYFRLGWEHIMSIDALDHILFVWVLSAIYLLRNWRQVLVLVTAFTVGHSITLALSVFNLLEVPAAWVEFLIPCTIVFTALSNLFRRSNHGNKFEQLGTTLPTPNEYRTASGAPGPKYWQQRCDYDIKASLDEVSLKLTGAETDHLLQQLARRAYLSVAAARRERTQYGEQCQLPVGQRTAPPGKCQHTAWYGEFKKATTATATSLQN
jgi:hypothetical protein